MVLSIHETLNSYFTSNGSNFNSFKILDTATTKVSHSSINNGNYTNYYDDLGKPVNNLTEVQINQNIVNSINEILVERTDISTILDDIPNTSSSSYYNNYHTDLYIGSTPVNIDVTFVNEGAGYKNVLGYYFYRISDGTGGYTPGQPLILAGTDNSGNDYTPTIIFPNGSKSRSGGRLVQGHTRRLAGNNSDGTFSDVNVGFFLVPNGWNDNWKKIVYDNKEILHSTPNMNSNWNELAEGSPNSFINNDGYQSIIFSYGAGSNMLNVLCFEDIKRPDGDKDFNDAIFFVDVTNSTYLQTSAPLLPDVTDPTITNGNTTAKSFSDINANDPTESCMLLYTESGIVTSFLVSELENYTGSPEDEYHYSHVMTLDNEEHAQTLANYLNNTVFKVPTTITQNSNIITITYTITKELLDTYQVNNPSGQEIQVQLMDPLDNYVGDEASDNLVALQHHLFNDTIITDHVMTLLNSSNELVVENYAAPKDISLDVMMWGDPHLSNIYGKSFTLEHHEGVFSLFENKFLQIRGEFWRLPKFFEDPRDILRVATFTKKIGIRIGDETMIIDLNEWAVYQTNDKHLAVLQSPQEIEVIGRFDDELESLNEANDDPEQVLFTFKNEKHIDDVQNSMSINTKILRKAHFLNRAKGFFIANIKSNYTFYDDLI